MRGDEVHGDEPLDEREVRVLEYRADRAREVALALVATELAVYAFGAMVLTAIWASDVLVFALTPTALDDGLLADGFVVEVCHQVDEVVESREIYHNSLYILLFLNLTRSSGKIQRYGNYFS